MLHTKNWYKQHSYEITENINRKFDCEITNWGGETIDGRLNMDNPISAAVWAVNRIDELYNDKIEAYYERQLSW